MWSVGGKCGRFFGRVDVLSLSASGRVRCMWREINGVNCKCLRRSLYAYNKFDMILG